MTNNKTPLQEVLEGVVWPNIRLYEFNRIKKAAQSYADLPSKIEGIKSGYHLENDRHDIGARKFADDILNMLKDGESQKG
jgi:hypothetical protein